LKLALLLINIKSESTLDTFTPEQVLNLFEINYGRAKSDANFQLYYLYFRHKLGDTTFKEATKYVGYDNYFLFLDKSSILYYNRNPLKNYKISFPNENYYLWRIMVKFIL
jgi:hypothetical protein